MAVASVQGRPCNSMHAWNELREERRSVYHLFINVAIDTNHTIMYLLCFYDDSLEGELHDTVLVHIRGCPDTVVR
jgi:hypothetical protein